MTAAARTEPLSLNVVVFSGLCLAVAFAWDVVYATVCDYLPRGTPLPAWLPLFGLFGAPMLLCIAAGYVAGQWRAARSGVVQAGAAAWCVVAPFVVLIPFFSFMCFAFHSCFGD